MTKTHMLITVLIATLAGIGAAALVQPLTAQARRPIEFYQGDLPAGCVQQNSLRVYVQAGPIPGSTPQSYTSQIPLWMCVR